MSIESDLLKDIKALLVISNGLAFVPQNGNTTINGVKTFTSQPIVPNPTLATSPTTKSYVDKSTPYPTPITVATGDFDFSTLTNPSFYNDFTFTCSGSTASINHILNLPYNVIIRVATGKTITFAQEVDSATGYIKNPGATSFVAVGSNSDFGVFANGTGAWIMRVGGNNY